MWPRAVYVRKARLIDPHPDINRLLIFDRYYASIRLRWNSIERCRGALEDDLIDDLVEWSIWHYPSIRQ